MKNHPLKRSHKPPLPASQRPLKEFFSAGNCRILDPYQKFMMAFSVQKSLSQMSMRIKSNYCQSILLHFFSFSGPKQHSPQKTHTHTPHVVGVTKKTTLGQREIYINLSIAQFSLAQRSEKNSEPKKVRNSEQKPKAIEQSAIFFHL